MFCQTKYLKKMRAKNVNCDSLHKKQFSDKHVGAYIADMLILLCSFCLLTNYRGKYLKL